MSPAATPARASCGMRGDEREKARGGHRTMNAYERVRARSESQPSPVKKRSENNRMVVSLMGVSERYKKESDNEKRGQPNARNPTSIVQTRYRDSHDLKGRHGGADKTGTAGLWPCSAAPRQWH